MVQLLGVFVDRIGIQDTLTLSLARHHGRAPLSGVQDCSNLRQRGQYLGVEQAGQRFEPHRRVGQDVFSAEQELCTTTGGRKPQTHWPIGDHIAQDLQDIEAT